MAGLEACQKDPSLADALERLAENLAKAQGKLFQASKLEPTSAAGIDLMRRAMEFLAQALKTLQDVEGGGEAVGVAARSIAQALKTLHPVVQAAKEEALRRSIPATPSPAGGRAAKAAKDEGETLNVNVQTVLNMSTDHQFYTGFSENIEEGGIFVATFEPKPINSKVLVNFKLPGGRPVTARGVVEWVREYNPLVPDMAPGMGVKFTDLLPSDKAAIEDYIKMRAPMFYDNGK